MCDMRDIQQGKQSTGIAAPTENQEMLMQVDAQQGRGLSPGGGRGQ